MIKVGNQTFERKNTLEETWKDIQAYLHDHQLILVDEQGIALNENQIIAKLATEAVCEFYTKEVKELEQETIDEVVCYIDQVEGKVEELLESDQRETLTQSFVDLMEALLEMSTLCRYFQLDVLTEEKVRDLLQKALPRMEQGDEQYMLDVIEYEIIPMMVSVKQALTERKWLA
jgi:hypothetical protein